MFRRKEDGTEEYIEDAVAAAESAKPVAATPVPSAPAAAAAAFRPVPPQAAMVAASRSAMTPATPVAESVRTPAVAASPLTASSPAARSSTAVNPKRVLTVGPDIQMKGEIAGCDRVVIEGTVDATMREVHTVELTESGNLKGTAEVEDAEISGYFEGDLVVRGKLTIQSTGRVRGNVTYGEIEIQRGGQISGNIRNSADAKAAAPNGKKAA